MTTTRVPTTRNGYAQTAVQKVALVAGVIFLLVGIAGFVPGITTGMNGMEMAGHESDAMLMGLFQISVLHNIVHLAFGIAGLILARSFGAARGYLIWGGVIYLVILIYGLFASGATPANFVPLNSADNWLHLVLGVAMIALGILLGRRARRRTQDR